MNTRPQIDLSTLPHETLVAIILHEQSKDDARVAINNGLIDRLNGKITEDAANIVNEWATVNNHMLEASARKMSEIIGGASPTTTRQ